MPMTKHDESQDEIKSLESKIKSLSKEYSIKIRKLQKNNRAAQARAYVQQRLKEEAESSETSLRQRTSSCRNHAKKLVRPHKASDLKERRKSTGSVKLADESVRHKTVSSLKPPTSPVRLQKFRSFKPEDASLMHSAASSLKDEETPGIVVESKLRHYTTNSPKVGSMGAGIMPEEIPVCSKPVDTAGDSAHIDIEQIERASTDSEDIFMSPLKQVDNNRCAGLDTDNDADTDQVIVIPSQAEIIRNSEIFRMKNQWSKLKLSKYKRKNFVNPVKSGDFNTEAYKFSSFEKENRQRAVSVQGPLVDPEIKDKDTKNRVGQDISNEINNGQDSTLNSAQGMVYNEGQVIVFERQLSDGDTEFAKSLQTEKGSIVDSKSSDNSVEVTVSKVMAQTSSVATVCDNDSAEKNSINSTKVRRRSRSRKRQLSGFEEQRRSSRIAGQSSQDSWSQSSETQVISPLFEAAGTTAAKRRVIISSVFQCLVDEGRRKSDIEEFKIPVDILDSGLNAEKLCKPNNQNLDLPVTKINCTGSEYKELMDTDRGKCKSECKDETCEIKPELSELPEMNMHVASNSEDEIISPTLFDSQSNISAFKFSKETATNIEEYPVPVKNEKNETDLQNKDDNSLTDCNIVQQLGSDKHKDLELDKDSEDSALHLQQIAAFQVPKSDSVHSVVCVETMCNDQIQPYVACLCSSCLKLYTVCNNQWTCVANTKLGFTTRKKSGTLMYSLPDCDTVSVVLLCMKTDCTYIYLYTYSQLDWVQTTLDKVFSKSIQVCPLSSHCVLVSYFTDGMTYLSKYSKDTNSGQWSFVQFARTDKLVSQLIPVRGIDDAALTITKTAEIQIWNHKLGYLLSTVDISDVCHPDPVCTLAYAEKGFLFIPILTKKKSMDAGSVVVINPHMNNSETLTSLTVDGAWTGCSSARVMSEGLLLCRQNNGCIRFWNVYTGCLLATFDDVIVTCFSAINQHLVAVHKQCIHVFKLNIPSVS